MFTPLHYGDEANTLAKVRINSYMGDVSVASSGRSRGDSAFKAIQKVFTQNTDRLCSYCPRVPFKYRRKEISCV